MGEDRRTCLPTDEYSGRAVKDNLVPKAAAVRFDSRVLLRLATFVTPADLLRTPLRMVLALLPSTLFCDFGLDFL